MGFLSKIFKKKVVFPPADLGLIGTDLHSHFIPGIDDGSPDMGTTLELLREIEAFGYKKLYTTPHVMWDYYRNTSEIILSGLEKVRAAAKSADIKIEINAAAEYYIELTAHWPFVH